MQPLFLVYTVNRGAPTSQCLVALMMRRLFPNSDITNKDKQFNSKILNLDIRNRELFLSIIMHFSIRPSYLGLLIALGSCLGAYAYLNPIIPGVNPDPSILRVGRDYWLVVSSFEFMPGIPIYHSTDLVNWTLHSHALTRTSQLSLYMVPQSLGKSCGLQTRCRYGRRC